MVLRWQEILPKKIDEILFANYYTFTMKVKTKINRLEMASKIKTGVKFRVANERERKAALEAAKYLGVLISTRAREGAGFDIYFLNGGAK